MNKFKVGQTVKVKSAPGCDFWIEDMDEYVGKIGKIVKKDHDSACLKFGKDTSRWWFPFESLIASFGTAIINPTLNGQFRFNLVAANGEKVATSETYTTKAMAVKTLKRLFPEFEIKTGKK